MVADKDTTLFEWCLAYRCAVKSYIGHKWRAVDHNRAVDWLWCWQSIALGWASRCNLFRDHAALVALLASLEDICARVEHTSPATLALVLLIDPNLGTIRCSEGYSSGIGSKGNLLCNLIARNCKCSALRVVASGSDGIVIVSSGEHHAHSALGKGVVLVVDNHNSALRLNGKDHKLRL